ncbi:GDSL-type esterase/lipase family protein [Planococcus sp. CAU13]|uniref:GDSL-type esterase/lipase family protein n=1 Tax=Planococcus sp. CAU13 TaxID=1541197 RepID=UPI00068B4279|nr:GDSL-type esterase/lipase family protein [Planococcus sp. CAU13]
MSKMLRILIILMMALSLPLSTAFAHNGHHGHHDHGKDNLVALGDSVPYGYAPDRNNAKPAHYAYPYQIGKYADLKVHNLAVPGWQTDDLLYALENNKKFRQAVKRADYVTVQIGGNDFLEVLRAAQLESKGDMKKFHRLLQHKLAKSDAFDNINEIIKEIRSLTKARIVLYNLYNPFQLNDPLHKVADMYLPQLNAMYKNIADSYKRVSLADAYRAFGDNQAKFVYKGDIHPTKAGHAALAKIGLKALKREYAHHRN